MMWRLDIFVAFGLAAGVHVAGLGYFAASGGLEGGGSDGRAALSLQAAPAGIAALVADWEAVPEVAQISATMDAPADDTPFRKVDAWSDASPAIPNSKLSDAPEMNAAPLVDVSVVPSLAVLQLPMQSPPKVVPDEVVAKLATPAMPTMAVPAIAFEAPAVVERAVVATSRPVKRPARHEPAPAVVARGTGGGVSAGNLGATQVVATISPAARQAAQAAWASKIQRRIARHQSFPRNARGQGRVRLQMDILADGRLGSVRVDRSSGVAAFDKAALRAARAAAPFPRAPKGLERPRYAFAQWVNFAR